MLVWLTFGCAVAIGQAADAAQASNAPPPATAARTPVVDCPCTCRRSGEWTIAETPNFSVWTHQSGAATEKLARTCEAHRSAMRNGWLGDVVEANWHPRCVVVVHGNSAEFSRQVGGSLRVPVGCTTLTRDHGRIIFRRVDLRSDAADWQSNALPHELTHVALADAVPEQELPGWLNEGVAMTFETADLQQRRLQVLHGRRERGTLPTLRTIVAARELPHSQDADALYAACLSVVNYLRTQGGSERLLQFAGEAAHNGCDPALQRVYNIDGVAELERRWLAALTADQSRSRLSRLDTKTISRQPFAEHAGRSVSRDFDRAMAEPVTDGLLPGFAAPFSQAGHTGTVPVAREVLSTLPPEPAAGPQATLDRIAGRPLG
jgi:hypothetical protein